MRRAPFGWVRVGNSAYRHKATKYWIARPSNQWLLLRRDGEAKQFHVEGRFKTLTEAAAYHDENVGVSV